MSEKNIADDITGLIGRTPMAYLKNINKEMGVKIAVKLESFNPCSSVKDRIGAAMIEAAEKAGKIKPETVIIEPTSGNTGIGLAFSLCGQRGTGLVLTMPDTMSIERRQLLALVGC